MASALVSQDLSCFQHQLRALQTQLLQPLLLEHQNVKHHRLRFSLAQRSAMCFASGSIFANNPPITRTDRHPNGIPGLEGVLLARVQSANELYAVTCDLVEFCILHNTYFAVEKPGRSFMWQATPFAQLAKRFVLQEVILPLPSRQRPKETHQVSTQPSSTPRT